MFEHIDSSLPSSWASTQTGGGLGVTPADDRTRVGTSVGSPLDAQRGWSVGRGFRKIFYLYENRDVFIIYE